MASSTSKLAKNIDTDYLFPNSKCSNAQNGQSSTESTLNRLFNCWRCGQWIYPKEYAFQVCEPNGHCQQLYYHQQCFSCLICGIRLRKGDYYGLYRCQVYCQQHYSRATTTTTATNLLIGCVPVHQPPPISPLLPPPPMFNVTCQNNNNANNLARSVQFPVGSINHRQKYWENQSPTQEFQFKDSNRFMNETHTEDKLCNNAATNTDVSNVGLISTTQHQVVFSSSSSYSLSASSTASLAALVPSRPHRRSTMLANHKRIRTTFKRAQLDLLQHFFRRGTHHPNLAQLCQLTSQTGLTKRVLQVWFQNQRSKWLREMFGRPVCGPMVAQDSVELDQLFAVDLIDAIASWDAL